MDAEVYFATAETKDCSGERGGFCGSGRGSWFDLVVRFAFLIIIWIYERAVARWYEKLDDGAKEPP